jgi:signal transduction histidine kinase
VNTEALQAAQCLSKNRETILARWSERARDLVPAAADKTELVLRDALPMFLRNLILVLSPKAPEDSSCNDEVSREHGQQRARQGDYSLAQVLAEYFILQNVILEVLESESTTCLNKEVRNLILESIARGIQEAGAEFANRQLAQLKRSNEALEHFAHIASHDLQEPLRVIVTHLTLLEQRMGVALKPDLKQHFGFAVDAARRMKSLIDSLLTFSQVGNIDKSSVATDFNASLRHALSNLETVVKDTRAEITSGELPTLLARPIEIERLFQNLISNAIKFRSPTDPKIHISATQNNHEWVFSVADNGIGIEPKYQERVFKLFTRIHPKERYPGSGIGLAVCRRVAELHGGAIWSEANPDGGTILKFSIPTSTMM